MPTQICGKSLIDTKYMLNFRLNISLIRQKYQLNRMLTKDKFWVQKYILKDIEKAYINVQKVVFYFFVEFERKSFERISVNAIRVNPAAVFTVEMRKLRPQKNRQKSS